MASTELASLFIHIFLYRVSWVFLRLWPFINCTDEVVVDPHEPLTFILMKTIFIEIVFYRVFEKQKNSIVVKTFITWHPMQTDKGSKWQQWQQRPFSSQPPVFGGRQKSLPWNCWNWRCRWASPSFLASSLSWQRQHRQLQRCDMQLRQPKLQETWSAAEGRRFNQY